jgi:hypothetical protein
MVSFPGDRKMDPGSSQAAPPKATSKGAKKGAKGDKKGQKRRPQQVTVTTSCDNNNNEVDGSNKEYVAAAEHDFKRQARQPKDYFEKLLEAAHLNHTYPVKHKLKECTIIKNFMTSGALSKGKKPEGDPTGKGVTTSLRRRWSR